MLRAWRRPPSLCLAPRPLSPPLQGLNGGVGRRLNSTSDSSAIQHEPKAPGEKKADNPENAKVVFSGIQPTGAIHLGNYLGAIAQWVQLQKQKSEPDLLFFSIVDLHSLTGRFTSHHERFANRNQTLAGILAAGVDPEQCAVFFQSSVPYHAEMHWILSCEAGLGSLARMPTFKEKIGPSLPEKEDDVLESLLAGGKDHEERLKLGLFSYPVLQAADILLYRTTHVPVGEDQVVHVEFARRLARAFNHKYRSMGADPLVATPEAMVGPVRRVMSLTDPTKKMSKSSADLKSCIYLEDKEEVVRAKINSALTDSINGITYDPETRPGVANLVNIIALLESKMGSQDVSPQHIVKDFSAMSTEGSIMRILKQRAADLVTRELNPVREAYWALLREPSQLDKAAKRGSEVAEARARITMSRVRKYIGVEEFT